ncbi:hypothetical protein R1sor_017673 [Riccia sorocarpa]|uniref:Uncharacterized protein n=1 Tax=Riccia sorocarpa TaxID=122646 RepID=A0ABD3I7X9_9MARC
MATSSRFTGTHLAKNRTDHKDSGPRSDWKRELSLLFDELVADHKYNPVKGRFTQGNNSEWPCTVERGPRRCLSSDLGSSEKEETGSSMSGNICDDTYKKGAEVVSKRMSPAQRRGGQPMRRMGCHDKTGSPDSLDDVQLMRRMSCTQEKKAADKGGMTIENFDGSKRHLPIGTNHRTISATLKAWKIGTLEEIGSEPKKILSTMLDLSPITLLGEDKRKRNFVIDSPVQHRRLSYSSDPQDCSQQDGGSRHASFAGSSGAAQLENNDGPCLAPVVSFDNSTNVTDRNRILPTEMYRHRETVREGRSKKTVAGSGSGRLNPAEQQKRSTKDKLGTSSVRKASQKFCCTHRCLQNLTVHVIREERLFYLRLSREERAVFVDGRYTGPRQNRTYILRSGASVCRRAFTTVYCLGGSRLHRIQNLRSDNPTARDNFLREKSAEGFMLQEWLDKFFLTHCERQPDAQIYHLPSNLSKAEVYDYYKTEMMMKHDRDTEPPGNKKDEAILGLKLHRQQQGEERATKGRRRNKALNCPEEAAYISIDGMDQNKTSLPHFIKVPKSVDAASLVGVHLVGVVVSWTGQTVKSLRGAR